MTAIPAALAARDSPSNAAEKATILRTEITRYDLDLSSLTSGMCARVGILIPFDQFHHQRPVFHTASLRDVGAMERVQHLPLTRSTAPMSARTSYGRAWSLRPKTCG